MAEEFAEQTEYIDKIVHVNRVAKVVKGGRRFSFSALVVVGNRGMGRAAWADVLAGYVVPTLIGNILGGGALVATLNHAQVVAGGGGEDI